MKTLQLIVSVLLILCIYATFAQENNGLTAAVTQKFNELYPEAQMKKWDNKKNDKVEIQFVDNDQAKRAYFASDGTWLYMERDIDLTNIPEEIINDFKNSQWSSWKIEKVEEVSSPDYLSMFVIKVRREDYRMYLHYLPDGTLHNASSRVVF